MKDEDASYPLNVVGEQSPLLRTSTSARSLQQASETPQTFWNTDSGTPMTSGTPMASETPQTFWNTDSCTGTPMTTHSHARLHFLKSPRMIRVRSQSLGAEVEANRLPETRTNGGAFLPAVELGRVGHYSGRTKDEPPLTLDTQKPVDGGEDGNPAWVSIMYGMINATIVLPVIMSFGTIIYRDQAFAPYMPVLVKLTVISGVVHQLCFSTFSSLPFAVGQVQDAGLIFLSQMASRMVDHCKTRGYDDDTLLATVTVGLSLSTAILGCGLVLMGHLRLAQYVQLLPTSVVGGYLAYIGWFCGVSGVGLMAGSSDVTLGVVVDSWAFVLPGILGGIWIYISVRRLRHMAVLPTCILFLLLVFYGILWTTGTTVEEARGDGWIRESEPAPVWYHSWDYLRLDKVAWAALPDLILTELSMIFVVALSSSLDVAAIELELNSPLDYNHELKTVGISNIISGLTGGYTGSYIFSQSIFSLRAGIRSRLAGYVLALCQIGFLVLPFPLLDFVPNFFFGSLLSLICVDLIYEWLWDVRTKVTPVEYIVCLATFALIQVLSVEYGIIAGVGLYMVCQKVGLDVGDIKVVSFEDEAGALIEEEEDDQEDSSLGLVITE